MFSCLNEEYLQVRWEKRTRPGAKLFFFLFQRAVWAERQQNFQPGGRACATGGGGASMWNKEFTKQGERPER